MATFGIAADESKSGCEISVDGGKSRGMFPKMDEVHDGVRTQSGSRREAKLSNKSLDFSSGEGNTKAISVRGRKVKDVF